MTHASRAARLSTPHWQITSFTAASAAEPESGRSSTTEAASPGRRSAANTGFSSSVNAVSSPVSRQSAVAERIAHRRRNLYQRRQPLLCAAHKCVIDVRPRQQPRQNHRDAERRQKQRAHALPPARRRQIPTPHTVEAAVASSVGSTISAGFAAPACARRAIIVVGKS